ncbi:MAG: OmpA family protein [Niabella sp.]|nr:OmpA family protein [Niabella sp.]
MTNRVFYGPVGAVLMALFFSGCVSNKKFTTLQTDYRNLNERYQASQVDLAESKARVKSLEEQLAQERANNASLKKALAALQATLDNSINQNTQGNVNISKLVDEINASNKYIQHLVNAKNKSDSLLIVLTNNLTRSLSRDELQDVDVKVLKGVVYISLADNMLYKSGSYEISDRAGDILSKIAKIIQDYKDYEVLVEGNTDNVPINRPNIRNNWDLSSLRAASVVMALQTQYGIEPKRLTAGGRGEYNPVADNNTEEGKSKNRRTQIIITPKLDQFMELIDKAPEKSKDTTQNPAPGM